MRLVCIETFMKIKNFIPILFLAGYCTVSARTNRFLTEAVISTQQDLICAGTVRYPDGTPAADVHVAYYPMPHLLVTNYIEARTDTKGRYEIFGQRDPHRSTAYPYTTNSSIMVRDLRRNLASVQEFYWKTTNVDLILQPAITLSGSVKDTEGAPIARAEVEIHFSSTSRSPLLEPQMIKVNDSGQFSIPALPQGLQYYIGDISAKGFGSYTAIVEAKDTMTNRYEFPAFVLKRTDTKLAGRVVNPTGKPLAGAVVYFNGREQPRNHENKSGRGPFCETNTDGEGRFSFAVCDAPLQLWAEYSDPDDRSIHMDLTGGQGGSGIPIQDRKTNIVIHLRPIVIVPHQPAVGIGAEPLEPSFE
jgi:protocatechuate 3,4-dioxygenase beta subunit